MTEPQTVTDQHVGEVVLCRLDGVDYWVPAKQSAGKLLRYLWDVKNSDTDTATANLLVSVLGEDNYRQLMQSENLDGQDIQTLVSACVTLVRGTDPKT